MAILLSTNLLELLSPCHDQMPDNDNLRKEQAFFRTQSELIMGLEGKQEESAMVPQCEAT